MNKSTHPNWKDLLIIAGVVLFIILYFIQGGNTDEPIYPNTLEKIEKQQQAIKQQLLDSVISNTEKIQLQKKSIEKLEQSVLVQDHNYEVLKRKYEKIHLAISSMDADAAAAESAKQLSE